MLLLATKASRVHGDGTAPCSCQTAVDAPSVMVDGSRAVTDVAVAAGGAKVRTTSVCRTHVCPAVVDTHT